ncbi:MAG: hypothetical protein OXG35_13490 [Acidobacteria bacterium]|nr:hypothetical protein [Acidobacteriota bacterium]
MSELNERTKTIEGVAVVHRFKVYHHLWECDGWGWVTEDGRLWTTSDGALYETTPAALTDHIKKLSAAIQDTAKALHLNASRGAAAPSD